MSLNDTGARIRQMLPNANSRASSPFNFFAEQNTTEPSGAAHREAGPLAAAPGAHPVSADRSASRPRPAPPYHFQKINTILFRIFLRHFALAGILKYQLGRILFLYNV